MKKIMILGCIVSGCIVLSSCGGSRQVTAAPRYQQEIATVRDDQPRLKKRETREVDKLVAQETNKMRAVGIGVDFEEKEARREALRDAQNSLASQLETAIVSLTTEYHKKNTLNVKKLSEGNTEGIVEYSVAQKVAVHPVGVPEVYDASDGSIQVYVCVELNTPTSDVLGGVYDDLSKDQILGIDYDKQKFINDNLDRLKELRERVK